MKIAILQQNFLVGDVAGNGAKILKGYQEAVSFGADLVISTELAVLGYPPRDLLERDDIIEAQTTELDRIARAVTVPLVVGYAERNTERRGKPLFNSAAVLADGRVVGVRRKALLPTYDVFDEYRYFEPWTVPQGLVEVAGKKIGILVCEDIWNGIEGPSGRKQYHFDPVEALGGQPLDLLLVINGSPYFWGKGDTRLALVSSIAQKLKAPVVYSNQVGGNDELIFDGRSFAVGKDGAVLGAAGACTEEIVTIDLAARTPAPYAPDTSDISQVSNALVLGLSDYVKKVGHFPGGAVLGLSGGIDSAVVAVLGAKALGPARVTAVAMPSPFSSKESGEDAEVLAKNLGIRFLNIPIQEAFGAYRTMLTPAVGWSDPPTVTEENIQARIRGMVLMAIANRERRIVLGTGNKSELAMGYATLYGDMAAGLGVISDLPKTLVYELAKYFNREQEVIPRRIIEKPPSAELRPNQKDTDSLPPYEVLDPLLHAYIEELKGPMELTAQGFDPVLVARVVRVVDGMEFKRRQAAPGLKVTGKAFGSGRRMPIAAKIS